MDSCPEPWERQAARLYKVEDYSQSNDVYREYSRSPEPHGKGTSSWVLHTARTN